MSQINSCELMPILLTLLVAFNISIGIKSLEIKIQKTLNIE